MRTISSAVSMLIILSPSESTLALLCCRARRADSGFQQSAQRTPLTRLATMASPLPEPPNTDAAFTLAASNRQSHRSDEEWIIHRLLRMCSEIRYRVTKPGEKALDPFLVKKAGVIRTNGNFHRTQCNPLSKMPHSKSVDVAAGVPPAVEPGIVPGGRKSAEIPCFGFSTCELVHSRRARRTPLRQARRLTPLANRDTTGEQRCWRISRNNAIT